jgi:protease-4
VINVDLHISIWWILGIFLTFIAVVIGLNFMAMYYARKPSASASKINIAVMSISGILAYGDRSSSNFQKIIAQIAAVADKKPKALILRVNSPGGTMGASHEIYNSLQDLRRRGTKVVVLMEDVAASGGVYISMASDWIVATPGTITGSIGVILHHFDVSAVLQRIGVRSNNVKSGANKDMLSSSKPMSEEARGIAQKIINDCYEEFRGVVAESRNLTIEEVKKFSGDGRVLSAKEAKECGLIDTIGGYSEAVEVACGLVEISEKERCIREISPPMPLLERLASIFGMASLTSKVENILSTAELDGYPLWLMKK